MGQLIRGTSPDGSLSDANKVISVLNTYADLIEPWANSVAEMTLADISRRDAKAWQEHSRYMGQTLQKEIQHAPTGTIMRELMEEQVKLIKSLPLEAAQRVHEIATGATYTSARPEELAKQILATGHVTLNRARLIARTETSRAASNLTQARAQYIGSEGYIWRTSKDGDVRPSHKEMEGVYVRWSLPPTLDNLKGHAGCLPNCRCWAEPVIPDFEDI